MGPEERGFQRIQRGSDSLESLINGLCAGEGLQAARANSPEATDRQGQPSPATSLFPGAGRTLPWEVRWDGDWPLAFSYRPVSM